MKVRLLVVAVLLLGLFAGSGSAAEPEFVPYVDPAQLDCPWPKHSFYKQPWRGFQETRSGFEFLQGVGVNYHSPGNDEVMIRLLAETGIKTFRIEVGFGSVKWDESGLNDEKKFGAILGLCKRCGIRPTLLLNAHHGVPCPLQAFTRKAAADAPIGAKTVKLTDVGGLVVGRSGINDPRYIAAAHLITAVDAKAGEVALSRPLTKAIAAGEDVNMSTLKFAPLHPVGTPEFDETAAGWARYALLLCDRAARAGIDEFDVEIWNELSFGSSFTQVRNYYAKDDPAAPAGKPFLQPGGCAWELARRTVDAVRAKYPRVRTIWGFSNTTFFNTKVTDLPPGIDGQSYHPYGTGSRKLPEKETHQDHPEFNVERFTPTIDVKMPEGWAHTFIQTEGIMRHLNAATRLTARPAGTALFHHYMTEHGVLPEECGVKDEAGCWDLKAMCAARSYLMWLNKGVDVMHYFQAADKGFAGFGLMPAERLKGLAADAKWADVATPPMRAIKNLTAAFAGAEPLKATRPLAFSVAAPAAGARHVFDGDATHPPLMEKDVLALLPWQLTDKSFVVAAYVMSYDATRPVAEATYRVRVTGVSPRARASATDVIAGTPVSVGVTPIEGGVELAVPVTDRPRLVKIVEGE